MWQGVAYHSQWIKGFNAGGCGNRPHEGSDPLSTLIIEHISSVNWPKCSSRHQH